MDGGVVVEAGSIADVLAILLSQRCEGGNLDDDTRIDLDCRIRDVQPRVRRSCGCAGHDAAH